MSNALLKPPRTSDGEPRLWPSNGVGQFILTVPEPRGIPFVPGEHHGVEDASPQEGEQADGEEAHGPTLVQTFSLSYFLTRSRYFKALLYAFSWVRA